MELRKERKLGVTMKERTSGGHIIEKRGKNIDKDKRYRRDDKRKRGR